MVPCDYHTRLPYTFIDLKSYLYEYKRFMMPNHSIPVSPPSASPDCKLAHNYVNYSVVSVRYRRAFCVMHGLRH